jgi:RNA-directed DNA polymerase
MWSPQRYLKDGKRRGRDNAVLAEAVRQIQKVRGHSQPLPAILTLCHLAQRTGIPYEHLRGIVSRDDERPNYRSFKIRKRSGGWRRISVPEPKLKLVQAWLARHVLSKVAPHTASHAFAPGSSTVACATQHRGARWLIKMDIADFFGSITEIQVYRVFRNLGYNALVSFELAGLCTDAPWKSGKYVLRSWQAHYPRKRIEAYERKYLGRLPQGAPSSPMLANLAMKGLDQVLTELGRSRGLVYTRYSDDITFSTTSVFTKARAFEVVEAAAALLKARGLYLNRAKTAIVHPGARRVVLGLLVNEADPRLSRAFRDRLRQHFYYLEKYGIRKHMEARKFDSAGGLYRHLRGIIDYALMVDQPYAASLRERLEALPWSSS